MEGGWGAIPVSGGSQGRRLACALLKQETTVRAQISNIAARAHVLCSKMLFQFVSIVFFPKMFEKLKRVDVKNTLLVI